MEKFTRYYTKIENISTEVVEVLLGRQLDLYHFLRKTQLFLDGRVIYLPHVHVHAVLMVWSLCMCTLRHLTVTPTLKAKVSEQIWYTIFDLPFTKKKTAPSNVCVRINPFAPELFFYLILAHPVFKMWIIHEPNKLALWNKLHFEEKKTESIEHV